MPLRPDFTLDALHRRQAGTLPEHYGVRVLAVEEGRLRSEMTIAPWMLAPNGFLHAASVVMLADTSAGYACAAHLPDNAKGWTTIELKSNFLGTALDGTISCEATADHLGRSTQVWSAVVLAPSGKRMALFRCTQIVLF